MIAGIFPGDGSEYPGMSDLIGTCETEPVNVGFDIRNINDDVLGDRLNAQISVYLVSTFLWDRFRDVIDISFVSGHSLGFYSALYASGVVSRRDGVEIVRAAFSAIKQVTSGIRGGMTAIIGLKWDIIDDICKEITNVSIANINSATQVVVSGTTDGLEEIEKKVIEEGALDIKRLNIDAPLHSPLMKGISDLIGEKISHIELSRPRLPIVNHTQPEILSDADTIKDVLCNQLTRKVLWRDAIIFMKEKGVDEYIEIGPLNVLSKIVRWIDRDAITRTSEEIMASGERDCG